MNPVNAGGKVQAWVPYVGLLVALAAPAAYMTVAFNTLNSRIDDLDRHLSERIDRIEEKVDSIDQKLDRLLIALAGRGISVPAKPLPKQ